MHNSPAMPSPTKLILSRKGFDSAHGGCPSPILDDNLLCSLPIPDAGSGPKLQVIFGWLEVGAVHPVTNPLAAKIPWARQHPHLTAPNRYKRNTVYLASKHLSSLDLDSPGAGVFERLRPELILTETNPHQGCANWKLPQWLHPGQRTPLSYHQNPTRWTKDAESVHLKSAYPGQDFVLDLNQYPEAFGWRRRIFRSCESARA